MRWLLAVLALTWLTPVLALEVIRAGDTLILRGEITEADRGLDLTVPTRQGVRHVLLVDSPGGDFDASMRIAAAVRANGLTTTALGRCLSGCAFIFVAGVERAFTAQVFTTVGFHGAYHKDTLVPARVFALEIMGHISRMTDARFPYVLLHEVVYELRSTDMLYVLPSMYDHMVEICVTTKAVATCNRVPDATGLSLGVLTDPLPRHLRPHVRAALVNPNPP